MFSDKVSLPASEFKKMPVPHVFYPGDVPRCGVYILLDKLAKGKSHLKTLLDTSPTQDLAAYVFIQDSNKFYYIQKDIRVEFERIIISNEGPEQVFKGALYITLKNTLDEDNAIKPKTTQITIQYLNGTLSKETSATNVLRVLSCEYDNDEQFQCLNELADAGISTLGNFKLTIAPQTDKKNVGSKPDVVNSNLFKKLISICTHITIKEMDSNGQDLQQKIFNDSKQTQPHTLTLKDLFTLKQMDIQFEQIENPLASGQYVIEYKNDLYYMNEVPEVGDLPTSISIVTPEGLYQFDKGENIYQKVLDKTVLQQIKLYEYIAGDSEARSIIAELTRTEAGQKILEQLNIQSSTPPEPILGFTFLWSQQIKGRVVYDKVHEKDDQYFPWKVYTLQQGIQLPVHGTIPKFSCLSKYTPAELKNSLVREEFFSLINQHYNFSKGDKLNISIAKYVQESIVVMHNFSRRMAKLKERLEPFTIIPKEEKDLQQNGSEFILFYINKLFTAPQASLAADPLETIKKELNYLELEHINIREIDDLIAIANQFGAFLISDRANDFLKIYAKAAKYKSFIADCLENFFNQKKSALFESEISEPQQYLGRFKLLAEGLVSSMQKYLDFLKKNSLESIKVPAFERSIHSLRQAASLLDKKVQYLQSKLASPGILEVAYSKNLLLPKDKNIFNPLIQKKLEKTKKILEGLQHFEEEFKEPTQKKEISKPYLVALMDFYLGKLYWDTINENPAEEAQRKEDILVLNEAIRQCKNLRINFIIKEEHEYVTTLEILRQQLKTIHLNKINSTLLEKIKKNKFNHIYEKHLNQLHTDHEVARIKFFTAHENLNKIKEKIAQIKQEKALATHDKSAKYRTLDRLIRAYNQKDIITASIDRLFNQAKEELETAQNNLLNTKTAGWKYFTIGVLTILGLGMCATGVGSLLGIAFLATTIISALGGATCIGGIAYVGFAFNHDRRLKKQFLHKQNIFLQQKTSKFQHDQELAGLDTAIGEAKPPLIIAREGLVSIKRSLLEVNKEGFDAHCAFILAKEEMEHTEKKLHSFEATLALPPCEVKNQKTPITKKTKAPLESPQRPRFYTLFAPSSAIGPEEKKDFIQRPRSFSHG